MGKFETLQRLFEGHEFNDSAAILVSIEDGVLGVTPFGGTFEDLSNSDGIEVYGLTSYLLEQAMSYGGIEEDTQGRTKLVETGDKH